MSFWDYFSGTKTTTAATAKERLQVIVALERSQRNQQNKPDYLPKMQKEILEVIKKYVNIDIDLDNVDVQLNSDNNCSVIELNVTLPEPLQKMAL